MTDVTVTQADREAWDRYGPMIFYGDATGAAVIAQVRQEARIAALEEAAIVMEQRAAMYREKAAKRDTSAPDTMNAHDGSMLCAEASEYGGTAIRSLAGRVG